VNKVIQSLWIGQRLSVMERLSIASFLANGHEYHLYAYEDVENVPAGTLLRAADKILPRPLIFQYKKYPSYAGFSNFFRYKLLLNNGGWWADTDVICLKHFAFEEPYVFASEPIEGCDVPTTAVIKVPAGSDMMQFNFDVCQSCPDPSNVVWGEHGPKLMETAIEKFGMRGQIKCARVFCPLAYNQWEAVLFPGHAWNADKTSYAIHLWNEMWRRSCRNKDSSYPADCLYERLKAKYLSRC
jgi:hypothetical protein